MKAAGVVGAAIGLVVALLPSAAKAADDPAYTWTLSGPANSAVTFTVDRSVTLHDEQGGWLSPEITAAPGTTYAGYLIETAKGRELVGGAVAVYSGAFGTRGRVWLEVGPFSTIVLEPDVRYRMILVSNHPQRMRIATKGAHARAFHAHTPVRVETAAEDVFMLPNTADAEMRLPGAGGSAAIAAIFQADAVGATYWAWACLVAPGTPCPKGPTGVFVIGPQVDSFVGSWQTYGRGAYAHRCCGGPVPVSHRVVRGGTSGIAVPTQTTLFGLVVY